MDKLDESTDIEKLGQIATSERDAFEACRKEVKSLDQRSAIHYFRLGEALALGKAKLGRGMGKPGRYRAWHVGLGIEHTIASRAVRLYEAAEAEGGEEALAGMGWWASLKHYGIVSDKPASEPERPNYWDRPDHREGFEEASEASEASEAEEASSYGPRALPSFNDIAFQGFRGFLSRHLQALGASDEEAEMILRDHYFSIETELMQALKGQLSSFLEGSTL